MNKIKLAVGIAAVAMGSSAGAEVQRFTREELAYMPATAQISRVKEFNGEYNTDRRDLVKELDTFNAGKVNAITFDDIASLRVSAALSKTLKPNFRDGRFPDFRTAK